MNVLLLTASEPPVPDTLAEAAAMSSAFNRGYPDVAAWARFRGGRP